MDGRAAQTLSLSNNYLLSRLLWLINIIESHQIIHNSLSISILLRLKLPIILATCEFLSIICFMSFKTLLPYFRISLSSAPSNLIVQNINLWLQFRIQHSFCDCHVLPAYSIPLISLFRGLNLADKIVCGKSPRKKLSPIRCVVLWSTF
jgi:hypothetical protein